MGDIYKAINSILEEVGAIGKDKVNKIQNFKFRGIDDVMNTLHPLLAKHKVFVTPEVLEQSREERTTKNGGNLIFSICKIRYTFYTEDGSSVQATVIGEGMDSSDKATNKAMAIAFKYALFQVFCIPTEEMKDPDADSVSESLKTYKDVTDNMAIELYSVALEVNIDNKKVDEQVKKKFGITVKQLSKAQYEVVLNGYKKMKEGR